MEPLNIFTWINNLLEVRVLSPTENRVIDLVKKGNQR